MLFIGIIVILVQKLQSPDIGGNESSIYLWVSVHCMWKWGRWSLAAEDTHPVCLFALRQEAGSLHSAPHSSVWDSLHRVRVLPRERQQKGASGVRAGPRILPGDCLSITGLLLIGFTTKSCHISCSLLSEQRRLMSWFKISVADKTEACLCRFRALWWPSYTVSWMER